MAIMDSVDGALARAERLNFFKAKRSEALCALEDLFNEIQREPETTKVYVFGSKERWAKWKEMSHDLEKVESRQTKNDLV